MRNRMGALYRTDDALRTRQILKRFYRFLIRYRYIACASGIVQPCVLWSNAGIIQSCRNRVHRCNLSVLILTEIGFHTVEHTWRSLCHCCCMLIRIDSFSCSLAADQCNFLFRNKLIEHTHCIAAAADTRQNSCRKLSFLFQNLCLCLPSDDRLEIPHDRRKRMRSHDRAQYIVGVRYAVCPLTHRLVYCIL